jgi:two-component system, LytTR family, response regulator
MKLLKTIIAEDSPPFLDLIETILKTYCPTVEVLAKETTLEGAFESIIKHNPNLVFLDIDFGGPTSFELLKKLKDIGKLNFQVIFLTAYTEKEHYINAFKYSALQYLQKPIDHELLIETVDRAFDNLQNNVENQMPDQMDVMFNSIQDSNGLNNNLIMLKLIRKNYEKVELNDIVYLQSNESMTNVKLTNGKIIKTISIIGAYGYLLKNKNFFRISQSAFVNMNHIKTYNAAAKTIMTICDNELSISRQKDREFRRYFLAQQAK